MNIVPLVDPEFKALIPPLTKDEREQLEENILSCKKCRDAIILWDGTIVDGHNRFEICLEHGIEFQIKEVSFDSREEAMAWILENQLGRRNLNEAARIEIVLQRADLLRERAKKRMARGWGANKKAEIEIGLEIELPGVEAGLTGGLDAGDCGLPADGDALPADGAGCEKAALSESSTQHEKAALSESSTQDDNKVHVQKALAKQAGVGEGTLYNFMQIMKSGNQALIDQVKSGQIKIDAAHKRLPKEIEKRLNVGYKQLKAIAKHMPVPAKPEETEAMYARLSDLHQQLTDLIGQVIKRRKICEKEQLHEQTIEHPANS